MKAIYVTPQIEIIELSIEGAVMVLSAGTSEGPPTPGLRSSARYSSSSPGVDELDAMISELLQITE